jgi:hypothetical protein
LDLLSIARRPGLAPCPALANVFSRGESVEKENGPYIANGSMRTLRAIYNHARKSNKSLPADNPVNAIDWNGEQGRDTGMGTSDLKGWFAELAALDDSSGRAVSRRSPQSWTRQFQPSRSACSFTELSPLSCQNRGS